MAPHHFLEMLRRRAKYPSQRIAHAWLNFVIPRILNRLARQRDHLRRQQREGQPYNYVAKGPLAQVEYINSPPESSSLNQTQFLNSYLKTKEAVEQHDRAIDHFRGEVGRLTTELESSAILKETYSRAISTESLLNIRKSLGAGLGDTYGDKVESMRNKFLGSMTEAECLNLLTNLIVNDEDLRKSHCLWPLWSERKTEFKEILAIAPISDLRDAVEASAGRLLDSVEGLISQLEQTRHELAVVHGENYVDETLQDSYHQLGSSSFT